MEASLVLLVSEDGQHFNWCANPERPLPPFTLAAALLALQGVALSGGFPPPQPGVESADKSLLDRLKGRNGFPQK